MMMMKRSIKARGINLNLNGDQFDNNFNDF